MKKKKDIYHEKKKKKKKILDAVGWKPYCSRLGRRARAGRAWAAQGRAGLGVLGRACWERRAAGARARG